MTHTSHTNATSIGQSAFRGCASLNSTLFQRQESAGARICDKTPKYVHQLDEVPPAHKHPCGIN